MFNSKAEINLCSVKFQILHWLSGLFFLLILHHHQEVNTVNIYCCLWNIGLILHTWLTAPTFILLYCVVLCVVFFFGEHLPHFKLLVNLLFLFYAKRTVIFNVPHGCFKIFCIHLAKTPKPHLLLAAEG